MHPERHHLSTRVDSSKAVSSSQAGTYISPFWKEIREAQVADCEGSARFSPCYSDAEVCMRTQITSLQYFDRKQYRNIPPQNSPDL